MKTSAMLMGVLVVLGSVGEASADCAPRYKHGQLRGCQCSFDERDFTECRNHDLASCQDVGRCLEDDLRLSGSHELFWAAVRGETEEVRRLLEESASDAGTTAPDGGPALLAATRIGHTEIVRLLLQHGVPPDTRDEQGNTALNLICFPVFGDRLAIARLLLDAGANANTPDGSTQSPPLASAAHDGKWDLVELLLERGASPDARLERPRVSALMLAGQQGDLAHIRLLLDRGADPTLKDLQGKTAVDYARDAQKPEAARLLESSLQARVAALIRPVSQVLKPDVELPPESKADKRSRLALALGLGVLGVGFTSWWIVKRTRARGA